MFFSHLQAFSNLNRVFRRANITVRNRLVSGTIPLRRIGRTDKDFFVSELLFIESGALLLICPLPMVMSMRCILMCSTCWDLFLGKEPLFHEKEV